MYDTCTNMCADMKIFTHVLRNSNETPPTLLLILMLYKINGENKIFTKNFRDL